MTWEDLIGNFLASIGARTAFYFIQRWLDGLNISISIGKIKHDYLVDTFEERGQIYVGFHNGTIPQEAKTGCDPKDLPGRQMGRNSGMDRD